MSACFHVVFAHFWPQHPNLAAEIETKDFLLSFCGPVTYIERQERLCDFMKNSLSQSFCSAQPPLFLSISQPFTLYIILLNSYFLYCNFSSSLFLHTQVSLVSFFSPHPPHSIISLLLHIFSLANVLPSLIHTLEYSHKHTHARARTHMLALTDHSVPPACRSVTDWLLPRRLGFVDVRNRTGTLDHRGHREDWCLSLSQLPFLSLVFPLHFLLSHFHTQTLIDPKWSLEGLFVVALERKSGRKAGM